LKENPYRQEKHMEQVENFQDILEAADRLSLEDKEALIDVLQRRLVDQRREEIAQEIDAARREFQSGQCQPMTPDELIKEIKDALV
jgi:flagellar motor switch protein FliG